MSTLPPHIKLITQNPKNTYVRSIQVEHPGIISDGTIGLLVSIGSMISNLMRSITGMKLASKLAQDSTNTLSLRVKMLALLLEIVTELFLALNVSPLMAGLCFHGF